MASKTAIKKQIETLQTEIDRLERINNRSRSARSHNADSIIRAQNFIDKKYEQLGKLNTQYLKK